MMTELPLHTECQLIDEHACGLIAVAKGVGVSSHPNRSADSGSSVLNAPYDHDSEAYQTAGGPVYLLHRLDSPTSGVLLLSRDAAVAQVVKAMFVDHDVNKSYVAVVKGIPKRGSEHWRDFLKTNRIGGKLRTAVAKGPVNATTEMRLLERGNGVPARALLELQPHSGRTHQLRVQCAFRHLPIIGDATYGDFSFNRQLLRNDYERRMYLHCCSVQLKFKHAGSRIEWQAQSPMPDSFRQLIG
jgi:23S rRNA-/tRNA-specific pseudouridylate synthase